jgi:hypothetical protein
LIWYGSGHMQHLNLCRVEGLEEEEEEEEEVL